MGVRRCALVLLLLMASCTGTSEQPATSVSPEAIAARSRADMARLQTVPEPLRGSIQTWWNGPGLAQLDPIVWQARLDRTCAEKFWINTAALHALGDEFVAADQAFVASDPVLAAMHAGLGPTDMSEVYVALWIMALNHCRDLVPPEVVAKGPPDLDWGQ